ncbi:MAG: hypothetical protein V1494_05470 [Candidatus Diapherotrites archaeon]
MVSRFDQKLVELTRRGDSGKAKWLKNIGKSILPSQAARIRQNDKTVLKELVLPKWVDWDLLFEWAMDKKDAKGRQCILCNGFEEAGIDFQEKYICSKCFFALKNL